MSISVSGKEFLRNDTGYLWNLYLVEKLSKNLMKGGNNYKVRKYIDRAFKNIKQIFRIHPAFLYFYIIYFFLITIEFKKVKKSGQYYRVPKSIMEEEIFLLRTIKLFSNILKKRWDWESDLQSKVFVEFFYIIFFMKRSKFYNNGLKKYYDDTEEGIKHISNRYRW
jgi:hypothetical protein